ncbi:unnamed protein product (macronuclear) [Paramecium tetraurelia]|uniref:Uncharacterized protein n=1 Tax=Paramecium tetraurelia TaxID=5888 RepID=A0BDL1_PARTE|nr:uncharacterized protein GSPATT00027657001 [Paramecium tetraurelia]CAK56628.1 unnamed protein product [Paramecium tetraurelia]|eukprot:XP_001424026.1 hypothetical protein (macronuclear) [Paramecium tetraurelia strain d4-2]
MASPSQLIFIGLIHFEIREQDRRILKKQSLAQIEDSDVKEFLRSEQEYERTRNKAQSPFFKKMDKNPNYLLVLEPSLVSQVNQTLRGIEDHIAEHLPIELPEDEWKQRAIKILLTWNLSEKNELAKFATGSEQVEKHYLEFGLLFLVLAVIGYVMIFVMKHMI